MAANRSTVNLGSSSLSQFLNSVIGLYKVPIAKLSKEIGFIKVVTELGISVNSCSAFIKRNILGGGKNGMKYAYRRLVTGFKGIAKFLPPLNQRFEYDKKPFDLWV